MFLGLGAYRAWIEIAFVGSFLDIPTQAYVGRDTFDVVMVIVLLACALFSRKIAPFFNKNIVFWACLISLFISTSCVFIPLFQPETAALLAWPSAILGGAGIALAILLWSELYSCLNPIRVALYYSASIVISALIIYLLQGFLLPWLYGAMLVLPIILVLCVFFGFRSLPLNEKPLLKARRASFPWKPVLLMAIYAFAYGLEQSNLYTPAFGPHSAIGTLTVGVMLFFGVALRGERFNFSMIYRIALPLMVGAFLIVPAFGFLNQQITNFCSTASYTAFSILIMLILSNISYRYGISAVWLFGIERGVRSIFNYLGRQTSTLTEGLNISGIDSSILISVCIILLVIVGTMILLSEKELAGKWGITFLDHSGQEDAALVKQEEIQNRCHELAVQKKLSQREEEVVGLLVQHKTNAVIAQELFISNLTAKTHVRNIYKKLDIHSREELFDLLNLYH